MAFSKFMTERMTRYLAKQLQAEKLVTASQGSVQVNFETGIDNRGIYLTELTVDGENLDPMALALARRVIEKDLNSLISDGIEENWPKIHNRLAKFLEFGNSKNLTKAQTFDKFVAESQVMAENAEESLNRGVIQGKDGKFMARARALSLLNLAMYKHIKMDMQEPGAPLKWRTGTFASSAFVSGLVVGRQDIKVMYDYLRWPYSVFDPSVSNYKGLSSPERNPRRIIGDAIIAAAKEVLHARYRVLPSLLDR